MIGFTPIRPFHIFYVGAAQSRLNAIRPQKGICAGYIIINAEMAKVHGVSTAQPLIAIIGINTNAAYRSSQTFGRPGNARSFLLLLSNGDLMREAGGWFTLLRCTKFYIEEAVDLLGISSYDTVDRPVMRLHNRVG